MSAPPVPTLEKVNDQNVRENRAYWTNYHWPEGGDEWSKPWGGSEQMWYSAILPRLHSFLPTGHILEIAPGYGRVTNYLRFWCERLTVVDLAPKCIAACRERFAADRHIEYHVNDGRSLGMIADNSVDFAFSWDSLVHVDHETVREYVRQLRRKLRPGGIGFIHHSNLGEQAHTLKGDEGPGVLGGRRPSMSAAKFRADCREFGLRCLTQEIVPWTGAGLWLDCFSLLTRDEANPGAEPKVVYRDDLKAEVVISTRLASLYKRPSEAM